VEISSTCAIKEWRRLPMIVSQVHVSLLQVMVGCVVTQCSRLVTLRLPSPQQSTHVHCTRSAVTATELLQPRDLACGTLHQSSCLILTSPMDRTFAATGPRLWNSVPVQLRNPTSPTDRTFAATGPRLWNSLPVQLLNPDITYGQNFCSRRTSPVELSSSPAA